MALALGERWDQSFARTLDHLRRALPRERAEVLIQPGAGVRPDLVDERLAIPIEGARAPVRALEALLTLCRPFDRLELAERSRHLLGSEVGAAGAVFSEVESVGIAGGEAHDAQAGSADPDRWPRPLGRLRRADRVVDPVVLSVVGRAVVLPEPSRDLETVAELLHAITGRGKVVAVRPVLVLFPTRADAELEPAAGHVIDAGRHLRLERGVAVLDRGHENAEADLGRIARQSGQEGPCLEAVAVRRPTGAAEEMVTHPERCEPGLLRALREVADLPVRPPRRRRNDHSKPHVPDASHCARQRSSP